MGEITIDNFIYLGYNYYMKRNIQLHSNAEKFLAKTDRNTRNRLLNSFNGLLEVPPIGDIKPLKGSTKAFRVRVGKFRIIFEIEENTVRIINIDSRGQIYKGGI
jgi:mRNA interferase RelE/StbE